MNDKQMITINENSIFYKIKRLFKKLFYNKNKSKIVVKEQNIELNNNFLDEENLSNNAINNNILVIPKEINNKNDIKIEKYEPINEIDEKEQFLKQLEDNPKMLELLSNDRLKRLDEYYMDIINKNNEIINNLI